MRRIDLATLDSHLVADVGGNNEGYTGWEAGPESDAFTDQYWHVVHSVERQRGGIVQLGVGSSKNTYWTDASTPEEVLARHHANDIVTELAR